MLKKKSQKPTEYDIHIKYQCPECQQDHWLSYQEASTKRFIVVCSCKYVFRVKRPTGFSLEYQKTTTEIQQPVKEELSIDILDKSMLLLVRYGFTQSEAKELLLSSFAANPTNDYALLVKQTLESIRN